MSMIMRGRGLERTCSVCEWAESDCSCSKIVRPSPDGEALVTLLCTVLSVRAGETLTPELIQERARNGAASLLGAYRMEPIE